ncbi:thiol-disulfide oxidoreductase DCC family protein [Streptomyces sp. NPDC048392]|uniref:thiol-disulfide oxidoreductase DCC family protein n=1 Tax=Streptomyces sp. NPDC048392 TaxID=3365543 RepID=UPI00371930A7
MRTRPVLIYDGDCGFCTTAVRVIERRARPRCEIVPWQQADLGAFGVTRERAQHEVLWATPIGTVYGGADAVAKLLLSAGGAWSVLGAALRLLPARWAGHAVYRLVANNRSWLPGATEACSLPGARANGP